MIVIARLKKTGNRPLRHPSAEKVGTGRLAWMVPFSLIGLLWRNCCIQSSFSGGTRSSISSRMAIWLTQLIALRMSTAKI